MTKSLYFNLYSIKSFHLFLYSKQKKGGLRMYPAEIVMPMKAELTDNGFDELLTAGDVDTTLGKEGTTLVMVNSVCGCAAGAARPGVVMAINNSTKRPDNLTTVFAGFDIAAVNKVREHLLPYPPSSPAIALFKDGNLVHMVERHQIEGRPAQVIAKNLIAAFEEYC
jgi:putative YphP/YqiW family bacilliredoxin